MPTVSAHISEELFERLQSKADTAYRGKRSPYIIDLIERDLSNIVKLPSKADETFFVDLCEMLTGHTVTEQAKEVLKSLDIDQRTFLEHILKQSVIAADWLRRHPDEKMEGLYLTHESVAKNVQSNLSSPSRKAS